MNYHITDSSTILNPPRGVHASMESVDSAKYVFRHINDEAPTPGTDELGWHYHSCYELLYFLRGGADYRIEQSRYTLRPHNLLVIKPGQYHTMLVTSPKRLDRIVIHFDDQSLSEGMRNALHAMSDVYCIPGTRLSEEILMVDTYQKDLESGLNKDILFNQLNIILAFLCNMEGMCQPADHIDHGAEQIISYIHSNLPTIHTLEDICQNVHMSRSTVQKLISDYLQTPVMSYVRTQRCILAKKLLQTGASATEVAMQCGFSDYSTFYRAYKNVFGIAPSSGSPDVMTMFPSPSSNSN